MSEELEEPVEVPEEDDSPPIHKQRITPTTPVAKNLRRKKGPLARLNKYESAERRQQIARLRMQGLGVAQIGKILGVSSVTVSKELMVIGDENKRTVSSFDKQRYIGEGLARYEEIRQRAWAEYYSATEQRHKLKALDVLRSIQRDEFDALIQTGIVSPDPEPQQVEHKHVLHLDWSDEMKERVTQALLQQSLRSNLAEPTPELPPVIDTVAVDAPVPETKK